MTNEEAVRRAKAGEPVYIVSCLDYRFFPCGAIIESLSFECGSAVKYVIGNEELSLQDERYADGLYDTWEEASAAARRLQAERGMRLVPEASPGS